MLINLLPAKTKHSYTTNLVEYSLFMFQLFIVLLLIT